LENKKIKTILHSEKVIAKEKLTPKAVASLSKVRKTFMQSMFFDESSLPEGNTYWEELTCVGFQPESGHIQAVVSVKQPTGYNGGLCSSGSVEYLRFFIDWNDGGGYQDTGLASFKVCDISNVPPGPQHPLQYMVYHIIDDSKYRKFCDSPVTPKVRAVLSWNKIPSLNPNDTPNFGNAFDATIQIQPLDTSFICLLKSGLIEKSSALLDNIDINAPLPKLKPMPIPISKIVASYKSADVPDHRTFYPIIHPLITENKSTFLNVEQIDTLSLKTLKIDISKVIATLSTPQTIGSANADITYEQVVCAGLNTANDVLGAVIHIKRPLGYSGYLCQTGSLEYVAFWADYDNDGAYDQYLGTVIVRTHDLGAVSFPADGLYYSVTLPCNFTSHLKDCMNPNIVRIRAVLSWNAPPSIVDPNLLNYWGNRIDVVVQLRPGEASTDLVPLIYDVGNVAIVDISPSTYLANPSTQPLNSNKCDQPAMDRPFGGSVRIGGRIYNSGLPSTVHFKVEYTEHGTTNWRSVSHDETFELMHPTDPLHPQQDQIVNSPDGWFPYLENWLVTPPILERTALLAHWNTGTIEGEYDLRLAYTKVYPNPSPSDIQYSELVTIVVHNRDFTVSPTPNSVVDTGFDLDLVIDGGDCHSYLQKGIINGHLRAINDYFWKWELRPEPATHTHGTQTSPACKSYGSLTDKGYSNAPWTLDTTSLDKCGYTATLWAYDRTIVNSNGAVVHRQWKAVGFSVV
jgi:hypothetical protein